MKITLIVSSLFLGILITTGCNTGGSRGSDPYSGGDAGPGGRPLGVTGDTDVGTIAGDADVGTDPGPVDPPPNTGCPCDMGPGCEGWCTCDSDCVSDCACNDEPRCQADCGCDSGCTQPLADFYPYNKCQSHQDCQGGFCAKGACVFFCLAGEYCSYGFRCIGEACLYNCRNDADCQWGDSLDVCIGGSCRPVATVDDGTTAPEGWTCPGRFYGSGDGCDCGCGEATDPDCDDATQCDWCQDSGDPLGLCPF